MTSAPIDIPLHYGSGRQLHDDPPVWLFPDYLSGAEIVHLLQAASPGLKRAEVSSAQGGMLSEGRTGSNCWIAHGHDAVTEALARRVAALVKLPLENAESFQVVHYNEGQEYRPHFDAWDAGTERGERCMARGGQRLVTCLMYLNDVPEGGGTAFPKLGLEVRARKGDMLLFHNCHPGTALRHPATLHGGMPVSKGEKWACNLWFREKRYKTSTETK